MKIRIGNDFKTKWAITWLGEPEDFSDATDISLSFNIYDKKIGLTEDVDYTITDNIIEIDVTPDICNILGVYNLELHYTKPNDDFIDGERRSAVDINAFRIVGKSDKADATQDVSIISDAVAIFLDIAYKKLEEIEANEDIRISNEQDRQINTATAISNAEQATLNANNSAVYANEQGAYAEEMSSHPPTIINDYWHNWNFTTNQYESTGQYARGDSAIDGALVVQEKGQSAVNTMSQKAVTDSLVQLEGDVSQINSNIDRLQKTTYNYITLDKTDLTITDKYYHKGAGVLNSSPNYNASPLLAVDGIDSITSGGADSAVSVIAFFDENETFISSVTAGSLSEVETKTDIPIPENAKYAGFSCSKAIADYFAVIYSVNEVKIYQSKVDLNTSTIEKKATAADLEANYVVDTEFDDLSGWGTSSIGSYSVEDGVLHVIEFGADSSYLINKGVHASEINREFVHVSCKVKLGTHGLLRCYIYYDDTSVDEFIFEGLRDYDENGFSKAYSNLKIDTSKTLNRVGILINGNNMLGVEELGIYLKEVLITSYAYEDYNFYQKNNFFSGKYLSVVSESKISHTSQKVESKVSEYTINVLGDSIVNQSTYSSEYGKGFMRLLSEKLGIDRTKINNYGVGGNRLTIPAGGDDTTSAGGGKPAMCVRYSEMTDDADMVIAMGGSNDVGVASVGELTGNYDRETFTGALRTLLEGLLSKYRGKPIVYCILPRLKNKVDITKGTRAFSDAALQICKEYGVVVADFHNESGICEENIEFSTNLADSITWTAGKRILYGVSTNNGLYSESNFIAAVAGDEFARSPAMDIAFYDSEQNYIDGSWHSISVSSIYGNFTAPANTAYVRVSTITANISASNILFRSNGFTINDGTHPNGLGNKKMAGLLYRVLQQFIFG